MQKKQAVQFAVLLVLILALAGAYFGIRSYSEAEDEKKQQEEAAAVITLVSMNPEDMTKAAYDFDGTEYTFRKEDDEWINEEDRKIVLDQDVFEDFLKSAGSITAEVEVQPDAEEDYGFEKPSRQVTMTTDRETVTLVFGSRNELLKQYYVKNDDSGRIYLVDESVFTAFDKTPESFEAVDTEADSESDDEENSGSIK